MAQAPATYIGSVRMSYMLRNLLCTIFVRKTAWQKYCFQILSPKKAQIASLKNPNLDLIRRIHPECGFHGFMIRFWICPKKPAKSVFGFWNPGLDFPKNTAPSQYWVSRCSSGTTHPTLWWFHRFFLTPSHTLNSQWIGKITTQGKDK